jgi:hypothetical protein
MSAAAGVERDEEVVQVSFVTKNARIRVTDKPIAVPLRLTRFVQLSKDRVFALIVSFSDLFFFFRYSFGLSEIINHLLAATDAFDDDDDDDAAGNDVAAKVRHIREEKSFHNFIYLMHFVFRKRRPFDFLLGGEFVRTSLRQHLLARQLTTEAVHEVEYVEAIPAPAPLSDFEHDDWVSSVHGAAPGVFLTASYDRHVRVWSAADKSLSHRYSRCSCWHCQMCSLDLV